MVPKKFQLFFEEREVLNIVRDATPFQRLRIVIFAAFLLLRRDARY